MGEGRDSLWEMDRNLGETTESHAVLQVSTAKWKDGRRERQSLGDGQESRRQTTESHAVLQVSTAKWKDGRRERQSLGDGQESRRQNTESHAILQVSTKQKWSPSTPGTYLFPNNTNKTNAQIERWVVLWNCTTSVTWCWQHCDAHYK